MLDHVTIRVDDREASERFYVTVLETIGLERSNAGGSFTEWDGFSIAQTDAEHPATRGPHVGFAARSRERVNVFWRAGTAAGYADDGAPGRRPEDGADCYGAFLLDPDGNSAEAVHHERTADREVVDHLWIRVADVEASRRFYATIAPQAGLRASNERPGRVHFAGAHGSFALVSAPPARLTRHVHLAFPAPDRATVDAFHRAALAAGHRDNGTPGERPEHHPGSYGACVLDPEGNTVEVVRHDRPGAP